MLRFVVLLLFSSTVFAETITVNVDTKGKSEYQIRHEGKQKVSIEMLDRMPTIISGKETLINGNLSTNIKALTLSAVYVVPISESWDRANQQYTLTANASVDEEKVKALFEDMTKNAEMKKMLTESFNRIAELQKQLNQQKATRANRKSKNDERPNKDNASTSDDVIITGFAQQAALIKTGLVDKGGVFDFRKETTTFFVDSLFKPYKDSYSIEIERHDGYQTTKFILTRSELTSRYYDAIEQYNELVPYMQFEHMCLGTRVGTDRQKMRGFTLTFTLDVKNEYKNLMGDPLFYPC